MDDWMGYLADGVLGFLRIYLFSLFVAIYVVTIVFAPVYTVPFLKPFVETIVFNNWLFFLILVIILVALKLFKYKTAKNFIVSFLYNLLIIVTVLYVSLYVFHFDTTIYSIIRVIKNHIGTLDGTMIEVFNKTDYIKATDGNWLYSLQNNLVDKLLEFVKWSFGNVAQIDKSCFHAEASSINILQIIWTCLKFVGIGGFAVIGTILFGLFVLICGVVPAAIPWIVALFIVWITNKLIFEKRYGKDYNSILFKFLWPKMFRRS